MQSMPATTGADHHKQVPVLPCILCEQNMVAKAITSVR